MRLSIRFSLAAVCFCLALQTSAREIALTFDDAPIADSALMTDRQAD